MLVNQDEPYQRDTTELTVSNADDNVFILAFQTTGDKPEYIYSKNITSGASADDFKNSIKDIYSSQYGVQPDVNKICRN